MILPVTATANHGLCGPCRNIARREQFEDIVATWERDPSLLPGTNGIPEPTDLALAIRASQMRNEADRMEQVCHEFFEAAHQKWGELGAAGLNRKEKYALAAETFYGEVTNGGLVQYLGNESLAFANWAPEAFDKIGIPAFAELMRKVQALFPDSNIPQDHDKCCAVVDSLKDGTLESIEEAFWTRWRQDKTEIRKRLYAYISK